MKEYTEHDILRLGKRHNNNKRTYLLINPLQSKHIPVSPSESLSMMNTLGEKVSKKYPNAKLVIGFAETATAIGTSVAAALGEDCIYIHTTRENIDGSSDWVEFNEEHSHAVEQKLYAENLRHYISKTSEIILVDDELSTGKTLINIIHQLKDKYPELNSKKVIAASIINRITATNIKRLEAEGIICEYLVKLPDVDYTDAVKSIEIASPLDFINETQHNVITNQIDLPGAFLDPRTGVQISEYVESCKKMANSALSSIQNNFSTDDNILVLGTEEFMYPAIVLGLEIENKGLVNSVKCHATTRSPIGVNDSNEYPIKIGYKITSFYDDTRETYIYNLKQYDKIIVVTDSNHTSEHALNNLSVALARYGNKKIFFIRGGQNV